MESKSQSYNAVSSDKISIIHLSDFHFSKENESEIKTLLDSLIEDINKLRDEYDIFPNYIVISGDIANKGVKSDYDFALKWLHKVMETFNISSDRVFMVPGNHDIDRKELLEFSQIKFIDQRSVNKFLESDGEKEALSKKLNNFFNFINEFYGEKNPYSNNFYFSTSIKIGAYSMGVVGLNSAWFSGERRFNNIVVDEKALVIGDIQAKLAYDSVKDTDFCMSIIHHPFSWLADFSEGLIKKIAMKSSDIILHGHIHSNSASEIITPDSSCIILSAGASFIENRDKRYSILTIDPKDLSYIIYLRRFSEEGKFWATDTMTYQTGEGIFKGVIKCESGKKEEYPFSNPDLLITNFIKRNWKTLAYNENDKDKILGLKKKFFHKTNINPSLHDIAIQTIHFVLKNKLIRSKKELEKILSNSYFIQEQIKEFEIKKIFSYFNEEFFEKQATESILIQKEELTKLKEREFLVEKGKEIAKSVEGEIKKEYEEKKQELEKKQKEIEREYELFKSEIDDYKTLSEEELPKIKSNPKQVRDIWYKEVGLIDNPFKSHIGLEAFDKGQYDDVVVKTSIFHKFDCQIGDLEKSFRRRSFLIYGTNGSGKTTFFKYLGNSISIFNPKALTLFIPLEAQKDHELIRNDFYQKLFMQLSKKYYIRTNSTVEIEKGTINDDAILNIFNQLATAGNFEDFIIFIDDLHKHPRYMEEVFEFIAGLQIIRAYLYENNVNLTLFLTGDLAWIAHADGRKAMSGSIDIKEKIPEISIDDAVEMINRRLKIFSEYSDSPITIKKDYVEKIFKILKARIPIEVTFRDIIEEVELHWQNYEFESLALSKIFDLNTLASILLEIKADHLDIKSKIDEIWQYYENDEGIFQHFGEVIGILYLRTKIYESTHEFEENRDYFGYLYRVGLITKQRDKRFFWALSDDVFRMFKKFEKKYGFKPQEYLPKLYFKDVEREYTTQESSRLHMILKTSGLYFGENFQKNIKESLDGYKAVFKHSTSIQGLLLHDELIEICKKSVLNLMKATLIVSIKKEIETDSIFDAYDHFIDRWFDNPDLTEFVGIYQKKKQKEANLSDTDVKEICRDYFRAMKTTISKLEKFIKYNSVYRLDSDFINNEDNKILHGIRRDFYNENYTKSLDKANPLINMKLIDLIYISSCLVYGTKNWMKSLPDKTYTRLIETFGETCEKSILKKLSISELSTICLNFTNEVEEIFIALFRDESFKLFKKNLLYKQEFQKINENSEVEMSNKQEILDYIIQMRQLVENVDGFYYKILTDQIPFIFNHQKLEIDGDFFGIELNKKIVSEIRSKVELDGTLELNLDRYIPYPPFHELNFIDWIMYIYHLNNQRTIRIRFDSNGTILISKR